VHMCYKVVLNGRSSMKGKLSDHGWWSSSVWSVTDFVM